jgi:nitrile hydratase accessory protein
VRGRGSDDGPPFAEPWQAQAMAIVARLQEAGAIGAAEWSNALGTAIRAAQTAGDPDDGSTYYHHVLAALETLVAAKGLAARTELAAMKTAWTEAYAATPHGQPVTLRPRG